MKTLKLLLLITFCLLVCREALSAQANSIDDKRREAEVEEKILPNQLDPTASSPSSIPNPNLVLSAEEQDSKVSGVVGFQFGDYAFFGLTASVPIEKGQKEAKLATLDGLADMATAELTFRNLSWNPSADPKRQQEICDRYTKDPKFRDKIKEDFVCTLQNLEEPYRTEFDDAINWGLPLFFAATASAGSKTFQFVDGVGQADKEESKTSYAFTGSFGIFPQRIYYLGINYRYEVAYKGQNSSNICTSLDSGNAFQCSDITIGAPVRKEANILQAEARKFFGAHLGLNPRISYDLESDVTGVELPVYFLKDKKGGLTGGVRAGWRSDTHDFTLTAFIGQLRSILK